MAQTETKYIAVKDDFLSKPLSPLNKVTLMGSKCRNCGEVFLGKVIACERCQSENVESVPLSRTGTLYSYTINRNRPPGDYKGPDPFQPFAVGLVELPEGTIILSVLTDVEFDKLKVGKALELSVEELYKDEKGNTVLTYKFRPRQCKEK